MQKVKLLFFAYVAVVALGVIGLAVSFVVAPKHDPDTYYAPYAGTVKTLDPAESGDTVGSDMLAPIFEGLYNYRYKHTAPYELFPELASAMPTVSPDGLTMTVPVRHGIHYYDPEHAVWPDGVGPELSAADFVYSFKRVCDYHTSGGNFSLVFQGRVVGADDWYAYTKSVADPKNIDWDKRVAGMTVDPADPYKLVLRFTAPYPQMIYQMVNNACSPVSRAVVAKWGNEVRKHPVGTGAYAMAENLREQRIVYTANPAYRGRPDVDGNAPVAAADRLPKIKRIQWDYFDEALPPWLLFQQGLFEVSTIPKDAFRSAIAPQGGLTPDMTARGIELSKSVDPTTSYIGFNCDDPVVGPNKPLRQAMSLAFDRQRYIDKFLNGRGSPAIGPIPPGFPTFDPAHVNPYTRYDLPRAKQLMADAVRLRGSPVPPIHILFRGADTLSRQTADFYVDQFAKIGIEIVPDFRDFARYLQMVDERQAQLFDLGWVSDYPDEQDFFQLFYGPNTPNAGLNATLYKNAEFDKLYEQSTSTPDSPARRATYTRMAHMVEDDCPWLLTYYPVTYDLRYDWLRGRSTMNYGHGFQQFYTLDQALRAKRQAGGH